MATKKSTAEQVKAAMAKVEAAKAAEVDVKAEEKKAPAKKAATKTAEKKTTTAKTAKAAAEKKTTAAKTTKAAAEKKTTAAKTTKAAAEKKTTTTKTAAKKATAKTTEMVCIQACGYEVTTADITAKVVEIVGKKVKELNIYVKPEEGMIYYTADGEQGSVAL